MIKSETDSITDVIDYPKTYTNSLAIFTGLELHSKLHYDV